MLGVEGDVVPVVPLVVIGRVGAVCLMTEEPLDLMFTRSALRRLAASSKLELVRVEAS